MLIEKIVVIAMGLVAVVPHGDNDGATILLRDALRSLPEAELADGTKCPIGRHVPYVLQLAGNCEGDCAPFDPPAPVANAVSALGLIPEVPARAAGGTSLLWIPVGESLQFDGIVPKSEPAGHVFQHAFRHGGGAARVGLTCLDTAEKCPIVARLTVETGGIRACTLAQVKSDGKLSNAGFAIQPFGRTDTPEKGPPLAETYAIEIETEREAPLVLMATSYLDEDTVVRSARLSPNDKGEIVMVVAKQVSSHDQHESDPNHPCSKIQPGTAHSAVVYDLARGKWGAAARVVPRLADATTDDKPPHGECYRYLEPLQKLRPQEFPSNPVKCKPLGLLSAQ